MTHLSYFTHYEITKERRELFLIFTKVLIKYLEDNDKRLGRKAKEVIKECCKRNKAGDQHFYPLSASIQHYLKLLVGEECWRKAENILTQRMFRSFRKKMDLGRAMFNARKVAKQAAGPLSKLIHVIPPSP